VTTTALDPLWDYSVYSADCPTRQVLDHVAGKWTGLVLGRLQETDVKRFSQLRREVGGISQKMLTQTLRGLERDGLVTRTVYPEVPPRVEYALTPLGHSLAETVSRVRIWTEANFADVLDARHHYDNRTTLPG